MIGEYAWMVLPELLIAQESRTPVIVDTHDVLSRRASSERELGRDPQIDVTEEEEASVLALADMVIAIQPEEAEHLRRMLPSQNVVTAMHPAEAPLVPPRVAEKPGEVLFVGSKAQHNIDAARWLIGSAWPEIRRACPHATLRVVGSIADAMPEPRPDHPGVDWVGMLDDLAPAYARAQVVVNCPRFGSGLKIKTIEALAHGRPLVASPLAIEGLNQADTACRVSTLEELPRAVIDLLNDATAREDLTRAAADYTAAHLTPARCFGELEQELHRLMRHPHPEPSQA